MSEGQIVRISIFLFYINIDRKRQRSTVADKAGLT
jgi:hypothetical protein